MNKMTQDMTRKMTMIKKTMLVVLTVTFGINVSLGQGTDFSGTYYINMPGTGSYSVNPASNYYLCPTEGWCYYVYDEENSLDKVQADDNGQPFLTTYICRDGKNDAKAKWIIQKHETENYYYIIYAKDSENLKYLTYNGQLEGSDNENRVRVHLESTITGDNNLFAITKADGGYFLISSKNDAGQYLNVTDGNKKSYKGDKGKDDGPTGYKNVGGIIGRWNDDVNTSRFYFEIPRPTFKLIKESNIEKIEITEALEDVTIYYTTDGKDPVLPAVGEDPTEPTVKYTSAIPLNTKKQLLIKLIATNKDHHTVSTPIVTYVYTRDITWSETSFVYNGTAQVPTVTSVKLGDDEVANEYKISCSNNINVGTAKLTLADKTANNFLVDGYKNFTIQKAPLTIMADAKTKDYLDDDPQLTFSVEGLQGADTKQMAVTKCDLQREAGEVVVDGGYAITSSETTTNGNYTGTFVPSTFTIQPKNFGTGGTPPSGISVYVKKNNDVNNPWSVSVYNGSKLFQASDFTFAVEETETAGSYLVTITGKAPNSTGYATNPYTNFEFPIRISDSEKAAPYFTGEQDMKTSSEIKPYIVNKVNPSVGTISITPISYIPKGVPVLLLTNANASGLTLSPMNEDVSISDVTLNNNKLMFSSDGAVQVADAQAYLYYLNSNNIGEFVLTTAGSIKQNRFYLYNPNFNGETEVPNSDPNEVPARTLKIIKNETTGLFKLVNDNPTDNLNVGWYTLDGRRLSGKPTKKGLYIYYGRKMVVK